MNLLRLLEPIVGLEGLLLLVALASALALALRPGSRLARRLPAVLALLLAALVLLPLDDWLLSALETRFPQPEPGALEGVPVTGVLLLGGALEVERSSAWGSPQLNGAADRVTAFAALARRHPEARLIVSSGARARNDPTTEAEALAGLLVVLGVPAARLELETRSRSTRENALESVRLARPQAGERWLLVTSAWHMPRAIGAFRGVGWHLAAYPTDYLSRGSPGVALRFAGRLARADTAIREWLALAAYRLASWTPSLFPGP